MIDRFTFAVDESVIAIFSASTKRDREQLMRIFYLLANNPMQRGDFVEISSSGRELQVKRFGKWLVTFWPDQPVFELRIVDVQKVVA